MHHDDPNDQRGIVLGFIDQQESVLANCFFMINDIAFLSDVTNSKEIQDVIRGDRMFLRVGNIEWSQLIIEFFHLFGHKENYSLHKLLNFSIKHFELVSWEMPDLDKFKELKKRLNEKQTKLITERVINIRHTIKAHLDPGRFKKDTIYINDAKHIYNIAEEIIGEAHYQLFGIRKNFEFKFPGEIETTITRLTMYNKWRKEKKGTP